jgi:hypothetical protein
MPDRDEFLKELNCLFLSYLGVYIEQFGYYPTPEEIHFMREMYFDLYFQEFG